MGNVAMTMRMEAVSPAVGGVLMLGLASASLSGCVAVAVIPAVAGGVAAKKANDYAQTTRARKQARATGGDGQTRRVAATDGRRDPSDAEPAPTRTTPSARAPAPARAVAAASVSPQPVPAAPLPADLGAMRPGVAYTGSLPSPYATPAAPIPAGAPPMRWTDVGRYVAALPAAPVDSALLVRGSTAATPAWVPCADRPRAVLVRLETVLDETGGRWRFRPDARQWLEAFQTLEIPLVFTSPAAATAQPSIEQAFRDAGLTKLFALGDLRLGLTASIMPAVRAEIAAQRCIIAIAGHDASDFPNGLLPDTSPPALASRWGAGWFRLGAD